MRTSVAVFVSCTLLLVACGGDEASPSPQPKEVFSFDSGGAHHIEGHGAWLVDATRDGVFEVLHVRGEEADAYIPKPLAPVDLEALWNAIDGAGLADLQVVERPGVPDEVRYTFVLKRDGAEVARVEVWKNDLDEHPPLTPLLEVLRRLIETQHGVKPVF